IFSGTVPFSPDHNEGQFCGGECFDDAVAMDDFVYGEPIAQVAPCPGDVNGDGQIDLADLTVLLSSFGSCIPFLGFNPAADLNGNGWVDLSDLATLLGSFGTACP